MARSQHYKVFEGSIKTGKQKRIRRVLGLSLAVLSIISCGLLSSPAGPAPTATVVSVASATTPPPSPTIQPSSTPPPPSLLVGAAVSCFNGPDEAFGLVANLEAGDEVELVGQSEGFWVVRTDSGSVCWVPDQGVIPQGDLAGVPDVEPPPVPTPAPPTAPRNLEALVVACTTDKSVEPSVIINQFHLYWQDLSDNEDGFRVYRDGNLVAELPPDKTEVVDEVVAKNYRTHYYYVVAYNAVGEAKSEGIGIACSGSDGGGGGYSP